MKKIIFIIATLIITGSTAGQTNFKELSNKFSQSVVLKVYDISDKIKIDPETQLKLAKLLQRQEDSLYRFRK
jgi:hypothetical protein